MNQTNQEALSLKKEYAALLRNVDQLTSLVERAGALGAQMESRQAAWDNYQLANLPSPYFRTLVSTFESRMLEYRQTIETIEKFVETSSSIKVYTPSSTVVLRRNGQLFYFQRNSPLFSLPSRFFFQCVVLKEIMQSQMEYFLTLTAQVSTLHDGLQDMQDGITKALKERGVAVPTFIDAYAPKVKKEKVIPAPRFEYLAPEQPAGAAAGAPKTAFGTTGSTFGAKPAGTGYGVGATTGTTGFGAKPAGTTAYGTAGGGFGAKPAGGFGATGASSSFGAKPAGTTGFGGAAKTGFGTPGAAKTGFGAAGAKPAGSFGGAGTGFRAPGF